MPSHLTISPIAVGTLQRVEAVDIGDGMHAPVAASAGKLFANIAGAGTTVVKSGPGVLGALIVNRSIASSVITIYDNTAASGTKIATITNPLALLNNQYVLPYDVRFANGLTVVTSGADDITVAYT